MCVCYLYILKYSDLPRNVLVQYATHGRFYGLLDHLAHSLYGVDVYSDGGSRNSHWFIYLHHRGRRGGLEQDAAHSFVTTRGGGVVVALRSRTVLVPIGRGRRGGRDGSMLQTQADARQRGEVVVVVRWGRRWWRLCGCVDRRSTQWARQVATGVLPRTDTCVVEGMATGKPPSEGGLHHSVADRALVSGGGRCWWGYWVVVCWRLVCCSGPGPHRPRRLLLQSAHGLASPPSPAAVAATTCPMPMAAVLVGPTDGQLRMQTTRVVLILYETPAHLACSTHDVSTHRTRHGHAQHPHPQFPCGKQCAPLKRSVLLIWVPSQLLI